MTISVIHPHDSMTVSLKCNFINSPYYVTLHEHGMCTSVKHKSSRNAEQ